MMTTITFPGWRKKAFTMSYDDGVEQDIRLIEIMKRFGVKGTFNLNGQKLLTEENTYPAGTIHRAMGRKMAYNAYADSGMEVALHSFTHPFLDRIPEEMAVYEVMKDREVLESVFGRVIHGMAYPMGTFSDMTVRVLDTCHVAYARTTVSTGGFSLPTDWLRLPATCHHNDPRVMDLLQKFVNENDHWGYPWLFYLWGHAYEFEANNNWEHIENILSVVGGHEEIWYATNIEIYRYVKAYEALEFSVECKYVYNPTAIDVYFEHDGKKILARAGETTCCKSCPALNLQTK